eukprot:scaffold5047_cov127-Skeletonema_menzelii.AAC.5
MRRPEHAPNNYQVQALDLGSCSSAIALKGYSVTSSLRGNHQQDFLLLGFPHKETATKRKNSNSEKTGKAATDGLAGKDTNRGMRQLSSAGHSILLSITAIREHFLIC